MIITVSGIAGSGKSTVAKLIAKGLKYKHYSVGDFMRELAKEKGISLLELSKLAENDNGEIDKELDDMQVKVGKSEDDFVIDSRLGFHFIPNAVKVFLDVELKEAAKRIFKEGRKNESNNDIEDTVKKIKIRIDSENKRYKEYYGVDYHDMGNYDIVIDTTGIKPDEIVKDIIKIIDEKFK